MAEFSKNCDIYQGYNYRKDKQTTVGFITSLKVGDVELTADQVCKDPTAPETDLSAVAVLSGAMWELGVTDAVYFSGQISVGNKQSALALLYKDMTKVDVEFKFDVYEYDPVEKKYFKCLLPTDDATLKGILEKNGSDLNFIVSDDPSAEVQSPENYAMSIGIKPQPDAQQLTVATSFSNKVVKAWGLKVE
ncbi:hypothetical protein [Haliangium sp.]|uniref:hypothetical protein n=1 Tax=Haliangium sp. TaxID=2663208 RepID=UPI003D0AA1A4